METLTLKKYKMAETLCYFMGDYGNILHIVGTNKEVGVKDAN